MIPVLITAIRNRPDLLDRMADSIDVPVGRRLVVDNGHTGWTREGWATMTPPFNGLGWPGAINFGITQTPDAPWWLVVNNDAYFEPGKLAQIVERMDATTDPLVITQGFTIAAINRATVATVGLFDEWSFYPVYFDDNDYGYRCRLAGVQLDAAPTGHWCLEGDDGYGESMTTRSDPVLSMANNRTWQINQTAYVAKWGGPPGQERFSSPWDSGLPLWATRPDPEARTARLWP